MITDFTKREHATILAALRHWQRCGLHLVGLPDYEFPERDIATDAGALVPLRTAEIDVLIEHMWGAELTHQSVAVANGWHFEQYAEPLLGEPGYWWRRCRDSEETNDPEETEKRGYTVLTMDNAKYACEHDDLTLGPIPSEGEFDVMVQQYVEQVATIRVRAKDVDDALRKAYDSEPGISANWRPGDDAEKVDAWAIQDHTGEIVWER